jgi:hypothetical protein
MTTANIQIKKVLVGRGNTAVTSVYSGVRGEIVMDTDLKTLRIHDGVQTGGYLLYSTAYQPGSGGTANTGDLRFVGSAMYNLAGVVVENADLTHTATASLVLPVRGATGSGSEIFLNNSYSNIVVGTGANGTLASSWRFGTDGSLTFPNRLNNANSQIYTTNGGYQTIFETFAVKGQGQKLTLDYDDAAVKIQSQTGTEWKFGQNGSLTLPNGSTIGTSDGFFGVPITTARGTILIGNSPEIGQPDHFHIMKAGQQNLDLFLGDDSNYVKLPSTGGVEISSTDYVAQHYWTFGTDGNLTFPDGATISNSKITAGTDSRLYLYGSGSAEGYGHDVRIFGGGAGSTSSNIYTGGSIRLYAGQGVNGGAGGYIRFRTYANATTSYSLKLDSDGVVYLPYGSQIDFNAPYSRFKDAQNTGVQLGSPDDQNYVNVDNTAVTIQVNSDGTGGAHALPQHNWIFNNTGSITFPDNSVQSTAYNGNALVWVVEARSAINASYTQAVAYDSQGNSVALLHQGLNTGLGLNKSTIVKLDSHGNHLWSKDFADTYSVNPWSLVCGDSDNIYCVVQRRNNSVLNNVVLKLDPNTGDILWQVDIQDSQNANNMQLVPVNTGLFSGVLVAGTAYNGTNNDFFIALIGHDGTSSSPTSTWGDQWDQQAYGVAYNNTTGEILLVGRKQSNTDNAAYLEMVKFAIGSFAAVWQKSVTVDGNYNLQGTDVCLLPDGNWAILATHQINNGTQGVITMKVNNNDGTVVWSREINAGCAGITSSITTDNNGHIYVTANTVTQVVNNTQMLGKLVGAYDTNGTALWQQSFAVPGANWTVDVNWFNDIGTSGRQLAVYGNSLLLGGLTVPVAGGSPNSKGIVAQLTLLGENQTIGPFRTHTTNLTDAAVTLTLADTVFGFTTSTHTLALGSTLSVNAGSLAYVKFNSGNPVGQLINSGKIVSLQSNGLLVTETGRSITGELDAQTDNGINFGNIPIAIKNISGYKRLIGVNSTAQTWITLNDIGAQLGINPGWINGAIIEYQVFACGYGWQGSMVGQIIIASNQNTAMNVSHTETAITNGGGNPADVTFTNLDLWHVNGGDLQARRTDSGFGQQLDITWTARVFVNASENYC